jgi:hypothetical protein
MLLLAVVGFGMPISFGLPKSVRVVVGGSEAIFAGGGETALTGVS